MKSDISRKTFDTRKHYSKVVMQQGRVQLDADWNEQQDILMHHVETRAGNIIGASGASIGAGGFAIEVTPDWNDLVISPGTLYVDGVLCELEQGITVPALTVTTATITLSLLNVDVENPPFAVNQWAELLDTNGQRVGLFRITGVSSDLTQQEITLAIEQATFEPSEEATYLVRLLTTYMTQPYYPLPKPDLTGKLGPGAPADWVYLVYLDAWQRYITALDDPHIREVALGSADTAGRAQTVWQVKVKPIRIPDGELLDAIKGESKEREGGKQHEHIHKLSKLLRVITFTSPLLNGEWAEKLPASTGKLNARIPPAGDAGPQGYTGLENQLYHVEIHAGTGPDEDQKLSFKWARDNASLLLVAMVDNKGLLTIQGSGQGNLLGLNVNQYVELFTPDMPLLGEHGFLSRIHQIDDITGQITLDAPPAAFIPPGEETQHHLLLRLWNGYSEFTIAQDTGTLTTGWFDLENNIQVQFLQNSTYLSGDYWLIPARTSTRQIEWSPGALQPRMNAPHHYARLSCLLPTRLRPLAQDCLQQIYPLGAKALHIIDINWKNDALEERVPDERTGKMRSKLQTGLRFTLDGEPDAAYVGAMHSAITVSLETALPGGGAGIFLVNGVVEIKENVIEWHWDREEKSGWFAHHIAKFDKWLNEWFDDQERYIRVRITVKGRFVWQTLHDGRRLYLDGQAFGFPASDFVGEEFRDKVTKSGHKRADGTQSEEPHIDLRLPSGAGRPASDFESWFYIRE